MAKTTKDPEPEVIDPVVLNDFNSIRDAISNLYAKLCLGEIALATCQAHLVLLKEARQTLVEKSRYGQGLKLADLDPAAGGVPSGGNGRGSIVGTGTPFGVFQGGR